MKSKNISEEVDTYLITRSSDSGAFMQSHMDCNTSYYLCDVGQVT